MNSPYEQTPGLDGPDYVTLVIEWDDEADVATQVHARRLEPLISASKTGRTIATAVGAVATIALATWGIRRLRAAL
jgi:hypothetical protein